MTSFSTSVQRLLTTAALSLAAVVVALLSVGSAGAEAPRPGPTGPLTTLPLAMSTPQVRVNFPTATITFTTTRAAAVRYDLRDASVAPASGQTPRGPHGIGAPLGGVTDEAPLPPSAYRSTHEIALKNLTSNTSYEVSLTASTPSGEQVTGQARFTTPKARLRVTLREINLTKDGDWGDGELMWWAAVLWDGSFSGMCYPEPEDGGFCVDYTSRSEGRFVPATSSGQPFTWIFAEENFDRFPTRLSLDARVDESDWYPGQVLVHCLVELPCDFEGAPATLGWTVPQSVPYATETITIYVNEVGIGVHSTMTFSFDLFYDTLSYPTPQRNRPSVSW